MNKSAMGILAGAAVIALLCVAGASDQKQQQADDLHYCEMVALFESSTLPMIDRPGWPAYRDDIDCRNYGVSDET